MGWQSPGLRTRLLLIVFLAVIPGFVLIIHDALLQQQQALAGGRGQARALARRAVVEQERLVRDARSFLVTISELPELRPDAPHATCTATLRALQRAYPRYASIGVATPDGRIVCDSRPLAHPVRIADRSYFKRALKGGGLGIGDYQLGRVTGVYSLNFGYPMRGARGSVPGVVYAALDLKWFGRLLRQLRVPPGSVLSVIDSSGTILADYPHNRGLVGRSIDHTPVGHAFAAGRGHGGEVITGLDGVPRLYAFAPLELPFGAAGRLYVSAGIPERPLLASARRDLQRSVALILIVAALVLVITWVGSERLVLRRVRALIGVVRRLAGGELSARTGAAHTSDEIGQAAQGIDDMATALERTHRALRTLGAGNRAVLHAPNEHALLSEICRVMVEVGGYPMAWIGYVQDGETLIRPIAQCGFEGGVAAFREAVGEVSSTDDARGRGVVGTAIRTGRPQVAQNFLKEPGLQPWQDFARAHGYAAAIGLPLVVERQVIGAIGIYSGAPDAFNDSELELLAEAVADASFGIAALRTRIAHDRAYAEIEDMARHDALTGLPSHTFLEAELRTALAVPDRPCALLVVDLNSLRDINDALGFAAGDLLIKEAANRLRQALHGDTFCARMRGGEFAVVVPGVHDDEDKVLAEHIVRTLQAPFAMSGLNLEISVTVGIARAPGHGRDPTTLLRHADVAMRHARRTGDPCLVYEPGHDQGSADRLALAGELRRAIEHGELVLHYQPKVRIPEHALCGAEALVRWNHPVRGLLFPDQFIALSERTNLIRPLTEWVIDEALRQSAVWRAQGLSLPIAVNLSPRNLEDAGLLDKIRHMLAVREAQAPWLEIEVTEGAVMRNPGAALAKLSALRDMGISLYIDDFGTGYSSLSYLTRLPMASVKIDKSFVLGMLADHDDAAIVRSTISLAHDLGLTVVAEGIETEECWKRLCALGCDVAQGYYISRPLAVEAFEDWVRQAGVAPAPPRV